MVHVKKKKKNYQVQKINKWKYIALQWCMFKMVTWCKKNLLYVFLEFHLVLIFCLCSVCVPIQWVFHFGFILPASYTKIHAGENIVFPAGLSRDRACAWDSEHYLLAKHRSSAIHTESSVHECFSYELRNDRGRATIFTQSCSLGHIISFTLAHTV